MEGKGLVAELQRAAICPACRSHFKDPVTLDCDHSYCRACINRYWEEAAAAAGNGARVLSCPQCKKVFERKNLRTNVKLAVEVKITQHLNAKTAEAPFVPKYRRRRGGWVPAASLQKEKASEKSGHANMFSIRPTTIDIHPINKLASQSRALSGNTASLAMPQEFLQNDPNISSPSLPAA